MRYHYIGCIVCMLFSVSAFSQAPDTLWTKTYGGPENDYAAAVVQTSDGGYIIAGKTHTFGLGDDIWLLKTASNGELEWTETYAGNSTWATDIQITSDGGYIIAGGQSAGLGYAGWLIKTDSLGAIMWESSIGNEGLNSVRQTSDGGYIAAGNVGNPRYSYAMLGRTNSVGTVLWDSIYGHSWYPHASGAQSVTQTTDGCYMVVGCCNFFFYCFKTDSLGSTLWYHTFCMGNAYSIQQTNNGDFVLCGYTGDPWSGGDDIFIVWLSSGSISFWMREYGGTGYDRGHSIQETIDNGYIITGSTESFGAGGSDVWLLKTNNNGDTLWTSTYGGVQNDVGNCVQQTADGGYIIVGTTESFGAGGSDIYLIKTESDVGYEENKTSVFVNKEITSTIFRGSLQLPEGKKCIVYDITGRVVDPSTMRPGIYFLEVGGVVVQKVVKIR